MKTIQSRLMALVVLAMVMFSLGASAFAEDKRITKEEVKPMLGGPELVIIDVRSALDWDKNEFKVKGAVREDPETVSTWMGKYPKDKTLVFYCS
jgi:rhodanese-related sulfurtransferase